jgi:predicted nucleic acid-binding protein
MIVVDASAMTELLLQTELGGRVEARVFRIGETLHAPHLLDLEVVQALRRFVRAGNIAPGRAHEAVEDLPLLGILRHSHHGLLGRVWELRDNFTAYDAVYLALAEALDAPFLTCDRALGSSPAHAARVEVMH